MNASELFISRKRRANTIQDALDGAIGHLEKGKIQEQVETIFDGGAYGPEPVLKVTILVRRDVQHPEQFSYAFGTKVSHHLGETVKLHGLESR